MVLGSTFPLIVILVVPVLSLFTPLINVTVTSFVNAPGRPSELKPTFIFPVLPGAIGVLSNSGVVQPQPATALLTMIGSFPVLVNTNSVLTLGPSGILPKSCSTCVNFAVGATGAG